MADFFMGAYFWDLSRMPHSLYEFALQNTLNKGFITRSEWRLGFTYWSTGFKEKIQIGNSESLHIFLIGAPRFSESLAQPKELVADYLAREISSGRPPGDLLAHLEGEYAIVGWDEITQTAILAVDPIGRYTFYYCILDGGVVWSSHPQCIAMLKDGKLQLSREGVNLYFALKGIPAPWSLLEGVRKVPGGHLIRVNQSGVNVSEYRPLDRSGLQLESFVDAQKELKNLLQDSVHSCLQKVSAPVGVFLSGGLDSTIITAIARQFRPLCAFTVGYSPPSGSDESRYAVKVSEELEIPINVHRFSATDAHRLIQHAIASLPEPIADMAFLPQLFLASQAALSVQVVLDGTGADALFGGSNKFIAEYYREFYLRLPRIMRVAIGSLSQLLPASRRWFPTRFIDKWQTFVKGTEISSWEDRVVFWSRFFAPSLLTSILSSEWVLERDLGDVILGDLLHQCKLQQQEVSRVSYMTLKAISCSVELPKLAAVENGSGLSVRTPFLSPALVEFALSLPDLFKVQASRGKIILRTAYKDEVPVTMLRRPKTNFNPPIGQWLTRELRGVFWEALSQDSGLFNLDTIRLMWKQHHLGWRDWSSELWAIFVLQFWLIANSGG